ncbi:MAG: hypothetical protein EOP88_03615 [Verrucomicrobiaceae bacterium]|nr:MAG: hypothetical protein EOP88_03615 [Verrucomicrobiaceae bacterium]
MEVSISPTPPSSEATETRTPVYPLPKVLLGKVEQADYNKWLKRKAAAHLKRDRKRWKKAVITGVGYKQAIHDAVVKHTGVDPYSGKDLNWKQLHTYNNEQSKAGGSTYKRDFNQLPTIDHVNNEATENPVFEILSWEVNDAKNDMSHDSFVELCKTIAAHKEKKQP